MITSICRRHCLTGDEADDFRSLVHEKFIEDDYAVLRKFRGISTLQTYLTAVIANRFRDYRIHKWGKWRPSAKARKLGDVAVRLETLISRDGMTLDQALETLRATGGEPIAREEAAEVVSQLPVRPPRRLEGEAALAGVASPELTDQALVERERDGMLARVTEALERALLTLPHEDQVIVRMRFLDGFTVAQISRTLGLRQKPLYDRLEGDLGRLRQALSADGVTSGAVQELLH